MKALNGIENKWRQLKYRLKHDFFTVENVVLVLSIVMCLTWTYQSIMAMSRNWELTERLGAASKNLELLSVEIEAAELENEYYNTDEYKELAARKLLDKQLPGENLVVLPENSALAKNKHQTVAVTVEENTVEYSNPEKWLMYLMP